MIRGFDVSSAQPQHPNYVAANFVIVKATEGTTYTNPKAAEQAADARALGMVVGFYHFLHPGNIAAQMAYFVRQAPSLTADPLFIDWEGVPPHLGWATCTEKDAAIAEAKRLRPAKMVGLYTNLDGWIHHDTTSDCGDALWIADPGSAPGHPAVQHPWLIHQYGQVNGMDANIAQFPNAAAMRAWASGHPSSQGPAPKPTPPPVPTYTVREGDTLTSIAEAHGTTWEALATLNRLANPNHIVPGQKLRLR